MKKKDLIFTSIAAIGLILIVLAFCVNFWAASANMGALGSEVSGEKLFVADMKEMTDMFVMAGKADMMWAIVLTRISVVIALIVAIVYVVALVLQVLKIAPKLSVLIRKISAIVVAVAGLIALIALCIIMANLNISIAGYSMAIFMNVGAWFAVVGSLIFGTCGFLGAMKADK